MIDEEPRHRVVVDRDAHKVFDLQMLPADTSMWHRHDSPVMYTMINKGRGSQDGRTQVNMQGVDDLYVHRVANGGSELVRVVGIVSRLSPRSEASAAPSEGIRAEPQIQNPWFRSYLRNAGSEAVTVVLNEAREFR